MTMILHKKVSYYMLDNLKHLCTTKRLKKYRRLPFSRAICSDLGGDSVCSNEMHCGASASMLNTSSVWALYMLTVELFVSSHLVFDRGILGTAYLLIF